MPVTIIADQAPALVGVVLGALLSYATIGLTERARWRREQATRWDQRRVEAYVAYAAAIKAKFNIILRVATAHGVTTFAHPLNAADSRADLTAAEEHRATCWEAMLMLADVNTINAARAWHQATWRMEHLALGDDFDHIEWEVARAQSAEARDEFYRCTRVSIGVPGRDVSAQAWYSLSWRPSKYPPVR